MAEEFVIDLDTWTFINHGAFGGATRKSMSIAHKVA